MTKLILLVGSDPEQLSTYEVVLVQSGFETMKASNATDAMQTAIYNLPILIICIGGLKDMEITSFCKVMRTNSLIGTLPLMLLSDTLDNLALQKLGLIDSTTLLFSLLPPDILLKRTKKFLTEIEKVIFIQTNVEHNIFDPYLAIKGVANFLKYSKVKKIKKKDFLFEATQKAHHFYYIRSGQIMTYSYNSRGRQFFNSIFCMGDFLGTMPYVTDGHFKQTAIATMDTEILEIPGQVFKDELNRNIEFAKGFSSWVGRFLNEIQSQMIILAFSPVRKRLANILIRLYRKTPGEKIKIKRSDLASLCGTVKETVIRTLSDFRQEGLIDIKNSDIIILNATLLKNMPD